MEFDLPLSCTAKIAKQAVTDHFQLTKDAKVQLNKAVGIFVLYLTQAATEKRGSSKRQTMQLNDVLSALKDIGFEEFIPVIERHIDGKRKQSPSTEEETSNKKIKS